MFARMAVEPDKFFTIYPEVKIPDEQKKAFQQERSACIAGKELAQKLRCNVGDRITIKDDIFPVNVGFTLRAIFESDHGWMQRSLYFNREYLDASLPLDSRES